MTYNVFGETLNLAQSNPVLIISDSSGTSAATASEVTSFGRIEIHTLLFILLQLLFNQCCLS